MGTSMSSQKEKQKQIDRQEHSNHTAQRKQDIAVKQSDATLDFCPGGHRRDDADEGRQDNQDEAEPIKTKMQTDAPSRNPTNVTFYEPGPMACGLSCVISGPE